MATTIDTSTLGNVVKLVGVVVSWGVSIYFLWVRKPPAIVANDHFFDQTRRISIVVISIFLVLTWGLLANAESLRVLASISVLATAIGIGVFFWTVSAITSVVNGQGQRKSVWLLAGFMAYSTFISWGLTAAVEFLAVILLNPANSQTGVAIVRASTYSAEVQLDGQTSVQANQDVPFRVTSGQRNFGCGESARADVRFTLPTGATLVAQATPQWENTSNASSVDPPQVRTEGNSLVASASIRGLPFQEFGFGVKNCPGGGHGEIVLTGTYRTTVTRDEAKQVSLRNAINLTGSEPVWITLPQSAELRITSVSVVLRSETSPNEPPETVTVTPQNPVADARSSKIRIVLELARGRLGFSRA